MLTHTSGTTARTKMLALISVVAGLLCFSQYAFSQKFERNGNMITFRGNRFEMPIKKDPIEIEDPTNGQRFFVKTDPAPLTMNGQKVYSRHEVNAIPAYIGPDISLWIHFIKEIR